MPNTTEQLSFLELLSRGGWVMVPLILCSMLAVAIIVERLVWGLRPNRVLPTRLLSDVPLLIAQRRFDEIMVSCRSSNSPLARILLAAGSRLGRPEEHIREAIKVAGRKEAGELQRYLNLLGTIASISPLLGLLGTVFGMIRIFSVAQLEGMGSGSALSGGISEALITTATGLVVAIPSLVFYRFFVAQAKRLTLEMEHLAVDFVHEHCVMTGASPERTPANADLTAHTSYRYT